METAETQCLLVADIGGTNARMCLKRVTKVHEGCETPQISGTKCQVTTILPEQCLSTQSYSRFEELMQDYLKQIVKADYPELFVCAIAGGAYGDEIKIGNLLHWPIIKRSEASRILNIPRLEFINDLVAAA